MTPAISTLNLNTQDDVGFVVEAANTKFSVSIKFINDRGQIKPIDKHQFSKLTFDSLYTTPFIIGKLQLFDQQQQTKFIFGDYEFVGSGGEFVHIKIEQQVGPQVNNRYTILNKTFVVKRYTESKTGKIPMLNFYLADVEYGSLTYTKLPWSTYGEEMLVSDAIKNLLNTFCGKSNEIINENRWNNSYTKIDYTLHSNETPLNALYELMIKYVSAEHKDMGLLLRQGGKFNLLSLTNIFKKENNPIASIEISSNDTRTNYSKNPASNYYRNRYQLIPVNIADVLIQPKLPDTNVDLVVNHSIAAYSTKGKSFNIYNQHGTTENLKNTFDNIISNLPNGETKETDILHNNITKANKKERFVYENTNRSEYIGKTVLQSKFLNSADRISFNIPGNFLPSACKFIGIELTGVSVNPTTDNLPGHWFVLQNTTTLAEGYFNTFLVSSKFDKNKV